MCRLNVLQLLRVAVLWLHLFLPSLLCNNLRCFYSPILEKDDTFELTVTECPPRELCFKADGRYGNHSALSARGCIAEEDCSQVHSIHLRGIVYSMSYACCDWPHCNSCTGVTAGLVPVTVTLLTGAVMAGGL